jgi:preprotein translocase subunit SecY
VQYAKKVVGRKIYGGRSTHLPLKVNMSGVMPIIFASSIATFPMTVAAFFRQPQAGTFWYFMQKNVFSPTSSFYAVMYFLLIIMFSYFYAAIQYNPIEIANNLKNNGGFIPGFRPGRPTSDFITKVMNKITLFGAIFLGIIAVLPIIVGSFSNISGLAIGGTSILIVVGVALETVKQLEAQMIMRNYKGFLE